ncbi:MAG: hypothetical protein KF861_01380 [Planctomycetaceae bacterium]|nr:hypothetical protein [Planctomycetaceae bacterium]
MTKKLYEESLRNLAARSRLTSLIDEIGDSADPSFTSPQYDFLDDRIAQIVDVLDGNSHLDIHAILDQRQEVAVIWCVEDVQSLRPDLDEEESWHVLQRCRKVHDCNHGLTWDLIQYVADDLYPTKDEGDGQ